MKIASVVQEKKVASSQFLNPFPSFDMNTLKLQL